MTRTEGITRRARRTLRRKEFTTDFTDPNAETADITEGNEENDEGDRGWKRANRIMAGQNHDEIFEFRISIFEWKTTDYTEKTASREGRKGR